MHAARKRAAGDAVIDEAPGDRAAERQAGAQARGQPILVEAVAEPGAGVPDAAAALDAADLALGGQRGGVELRVIAVEGLESQRRIGRRFGGFRLTNSGVRQSIFCRLFIQ